MTSIFSDQSSNQLLASLPQMINALKAENKTNNTNTVEKSIENTMDISGNTNQKKENNDNAATVVVASKCECGGYSTETVFLIVFVAICIVLSLVWIVSGFMDSKSSSSSSSSNSNVGSSGTDGATE